MRSPVMGSGGHGLADLGGAQRNRSPLGRGPRRSFGFFPIVWKEPRPAGRNIPLPPPRGEKNLTLNSSLPGSPLLYGSVCMDGTEEV